MVVLFYDGKIVAQLVALFNLLLKWYLAFCFCCILRDVIQNVWMLISFCSCFFALVLLKSLVVIFLQRMGWLHLGPTSAIYQVHFIHFINFK
jgi:hypothetical protein